MFTDKLHYMAKHSQEVFKELNDQANSSSADQTHSLQDDNELFSTYLKKKYIHS